MLILEIILGLSLWLLSGHAISTVYKKAGFINTPGFIFWLPALNLALLIYLAFADWPALRRIH